MNIWKICFSLLIVIFTFSSEILLAKESNQIFLNEGFCQKDTHSDCQYLNSLENLILDQNHLLLEMQGDLYCVQSLQREGDGWLARVSTYNGYCPKMHPLCECGHCHNSHCYYYVKYCSRKK